MSTTSSTSSTGSSAAASAAASASNGSDASAGSSSAGAVSGADASAGSATQCTAASGTGSLAAALGATANDQAAASPTTAESLSRAPTALSSLAAQPTQADRLAQQPPSFTGAAQGWASAGYQTLVDNPKLSVQWESTRSAWTGQVGFTAGMTDVLNQNGLTINPNNLAPAPGSVGPNSGLTSAQANPRNGIAADIAIEGRLQGQGYTTRRQVDVGDSRRMDVVGTKPNADPRLTERVEIESKAYRAGVTERNVSEAVRDGQRLADNVNLRTAGRVLEGVGRVARPVGLVMDAVAVGSAYRADGNRIGENTGRAAASLAGSAAGGWGGAVTGAAIGTAILPGVGTVVGGLIGGIGGALLGDSAGRGAFDTVRSWF